ncbi:hypothetical protein [Dickeya zeae]|uniref:hypothetical protein n=1 Tax=Dickeya zeae TaxID=204042 RepID=UPI000C9A1F67|nr:hypothetical protein [Dickeya zeae]AUQ26916.1 hypothetical protein C1O30_18485 [Dickeya zeae]UJR59972.1 hypothetical protein HJ580_18285 [Dickeya zeae]UJR64264.1 hypothetical protein HJ586_19860 [Dickeya zeae]
MMLPNRIRAVSLPARTGLSCLCFLGVLLLAGCSHTTAEPDTTSVPYRSVPYGKCDNVGTYHLYFDRFDETAQQLAHATGCVVITDTSKTGAIRPHPVVGTLTIRQAVQMAMTGTALRITHQDANSITVE